MYSFWLIHSLESLHSDSFDGERLFCHDICNWFVDISNSIVDIYNSAYLEISPIEL